MIKNRARWENWERDFLRAEKSDYHQNVRIFEALYEEARTLGAFPLKDPLEGIETTIRVAQVVNGSRPIGAHRTGA